MKCFSGTASHENFKVFEDEPPNTTDVEQSLKQLKANDPKCKELNFNNIKVNYKAAYTCKTCLFMEVI